MVLTCGKDNLLKLVDPRTFQVRCHLLCHTHTHAMLNHCQLAFIPIPACQPFKRLWKAEYDYSRSLAHVCGVTGVGGSVQPSKRAQMQIMSC